MIAHLLRKDWRARRTGIAVWIGLFALCLLVQLNPIDRGSDPARDAGFILILVLLPIVCLKMLLGIVGNTVGEDSPAKRERFLATRPVPARTLWLSKALFVGVVVILPVALLSAVFLATSSRDPRVVLLGTLQMILLTTAVSCYAAGFGALCSTRREMVGAIVTVGLACGAFGLLGVTFLPASWFDDLLTRRPLESTTGLLTAGLLLCLLAGTTRVLRSRLPFRLAALALGTLVGLSAAALLPQRTLMAGPSASTGRDDALKDLQVDEVGHRIRWNDSGDGKLLLSAQLHFQRPDSLEPDEDITWFWRRLRVNDRTHENPHSYRQSLGDQMSGQDSYRGSLRRRVEDQLGHAPDWVLVQDHRHSLEPMESLTAVFPGTESGSAKSFELGAELSAMIYRWECVAELPLAPGRDAHPEQSSWSVSFVALPDENHSETSIALAHSAPELWFSDQASEQPQPIHSRYRSLTFLLHDPQRNRVFFGLSSYAQARGYLPTGYREARIDLRIPRNADIAGLLDESWPDLRLMIFRPQLVEQLERRWTLPHPVVPAHLPLPARGSSDRLQDLSVGQLAWQYQLLDKPEAGAGDVDRFLDEVLSLAARCERPVDHARQPWTRDLAALVPDHLDLFLGQLGKLASNDYRERRLLLMAMQQGCLEKQADQIVAAFAGNDALLPLILFRGWTAQARPLLLEQFDYGNRSRELLEALDRIGAFEDPRRRARLLADLRLRPGQTTYEVLRGLEETKPALDAIVDDLIEETRPQFLPTGAIDLRRELDLILSHGRIEGVVRLHGNASLLGDADRGERYEIESLLDRFFEHRGIRGAERHDGETLISWFLERDPRQFRFDPVSRKFVWPHPDLP